MKTWKENLNVLNLGTVPGAWLGIGSHSTSEVTEGGAAGYHTLCAALDMGSWHKNRASSPACSH